MDRGKEACMVAVSSGNSVKGPQMLYFFCCSYLALLLPEADLDFGSGTPRIPFAHLPHAFKPLGLSTGLISTKSTELFMFVKDVTSLS